MAELGRRIVHASGIVLPALYLTGLLTWRSVRGLLVLGLLVALGLEAVRLRIGLDWWVYDHLTRPYESSSVGGYALYMVSVSAVALAFDPVVAIPSMLMLMLGDPVSGFLGSGELRHRKRLLAMVAMFLVSFAIALPFAADTLERYLAAAIVAAAGAGAATLADAYTVTIRSRVVDDNLTIPIVAALVLRLGYGIA